MRRLIQKQNQFLYCICAMLEKLYLKYKYQNILINKENIYTVLPDNQVYTNLFELIYEKYQTKHFYTHWSKTLSNTIH
jgi:hypothetical protein